MRTTTGFALRPQAGLEALERADTVVVPGYFAIFDPPPAQALAGLRARRRPRRPRALGLHRRLRARPRRPARRSPRRHPLGLGGGAGPALPGGRGRRRRALRRRGRGDDLGRAQRRHRPQPARRPQGLRRRRRRRGSPATWSPRPTARAARPSSPRPAEAAAGGSLEPTRRWAAERLDQPLDVAAMAAHAGVSPRTFARRFREETGTTPLQWLLDPARDRGAAPAGGVRPAGRDRRLALPASAPPPRCATTSAARPRPRRPRTGAHSPSRLGQVVELTHP